jgi:hypothetical protein
MEMHIIPVFGISCDPEILQRNTRELSNIPSGEVRQCQSGKSGTGAGPEDHDPEPQSPM